MAVSQKMPNFKFYFHPVSALSVLKKLFKFKFDNGKKKRVISF